MSGVSIPAVCVTALSSLVFVLGANVSRVRINNKLAGPIPIVSSSPAYIAARNHGNAIEYVPTLIGLIIWLQLHSPYPAWVDVVMALATASRVLFAGALLTTSDLNKPTPGRRLGAAGTYIFGTTLTLAAGYYTLFKK